MRVKNTRLFVFVAQPEPGIYEVVTNANRGIQVMLLTERIVKLAGMLALAGMAQFICFTGIAMLKYGGGTQLDAKSSGFSLTQNFLDDLGRREAYSARPNGMAANLFGCGGTLAGLLLIPFFLVLPAHAPESGLMLRIAGACGVLAALALIAVALLPGDMHPAGHSMAMQAFAGGLFAVAACHAAALFMSDDGSLFLSVASIFLSLTLFVTMLTSFSVGSDNFTNEEAAMQGVQLSRPEVSLAHAVTSQKVIVGSVMLWLLATNTWTAFVYRTVAAKEKPQKSIRGWLGRAQKKLVKLNERHL